MSQIESVLSEDRRFPPSEAFRATAHLSSQAAYERMYRESIDDPETFWDRVASELPWMERWNSVVDWSAAPVAKWFLGGRINASSVCVDQHLDTLRSGKRAIVWVGEPGDRRVLTYTQLHVEVCRFANALKRRGLGKGDRIAIYLPMVPEAAIAMLACARIGAIHSVVFAGFSSQALRDRIQDGDCAAVITADGGWRRGKVLPLKPQVDDALDQCPSVHTVFCVRRTENEVAWNDERDVWYHAAVDAENGDCAPEPMDSEDTLFLLYTSGSTGRPKGIQHTTGGYLVGTYLTSRFVFDLQEEDVFWCTADVGWVTGHSYIVYGPLANGATIVMYEGAPNAPHEGRFWELCQNLEVTVFYTAPTAIRTFMRWGDEHPGKYDLSKLRLLGTVGEPINPEAWMWYHRVIGGERCPIVDTWWQTETGAIMLTPLPGVTETKPGSATHPFFGVDAIIVDENGQELGPNEGGYLVIRKPWPAMLRGLWNDPERYRETYWSKFEGLYFAGDGARRDQDGYFWIMGRVDDVINVSGHRLSTMEVESALVSHPDVVEAAVVARPDEVTGQAICAFVTLGPGATPGDDRAVALGQHVAEEIGKIMRRLLRDIAAGVETVGDTSTLEDYAVLAELRGHED